MTKTELLLKLIAAGVVDSQYSIRYKLNLIEGARQSVCEVYQVVDPWKELYFSKLNQNEIDLWNMALVQCVEDAKTLWDRMAARELQELSHD